MKAVGETWTEEQLREAGVEYCLKHSRVPLTWTMLEIEQEGKPVKRVSFGVCEECERKTTRNGRVWR